MTDRDTTTLQSIIQQHYSEAGKQKGKAAPRRRTKPCQYEGCNAWAWARGYCGIHYQLMRREGKLPTVRIINDPIARFKASYEVNEETGCWEWTGWIHPKGYGILPIGRKSKKVRAHRFSWELRHGLIPDGLLALHTCDNRKCVNPDHLFLGDEGDNARDCVAKGRHWTKSGRTPLKISPRMASTIRILFARGRHSMQNLGDIYGVDQQTISKVVRGMSHLAVG